MQLNYYNKYIKYKNKYNLLKGGTNEKDVLFVKLNEAYSKIYNMIKAEKNYTDVYKIVIKNIWEKFITELITHLNDKDDIQLTIIKTILNVSFTMFNIFNKYTYLNYEFTHGKSLLDIYMEIKSFTSENEILKKIIDEFNTTDITLYTEENIDLYKSIENNILIYINIY